MGIEVRRYREGDWPELRSLLQVYWGERHSMTKKKLFDWQKKGFSEARQTIGTLVATSGGKLIGFRGLIPGQYQVHLGGEEMTLLAGGSSFMWTVREEFRGQKVGLAMELKAQEMMPVMCGVRAKAATSLRIYKKSGFTVLDAFVRYVLPLQKDGYARLLTQHAGERELEAWCGEMDFGHDPIGPQAPDLEQMANSWREVTLPLGLFSLNRSQEFYKWRYLDSTGFNYLFFGDGRQGGYIVARLETIYAPGRPDLHKGKVLRLIEIVPRSPETWQEGSNQQDLALLQGVCAWARQQGCLAADFYHSTSRFNALMTGAGFKVQDPFDVQPLTSLCLLFQPLTYIITSANTFFRINPGGQGLLSLNFENTCIFKSECDLDRPVLFDYEDWS